MQNLLAKHYTQVTQIRLVQDNLNTHTPGSFYEVLPPSEAFALSQRFEPHYTPLKGSWLNMAMKSSSRRLPRSVLIDASRRLTAYAGPCWHGLIRAIATAKRSTGPSPKLTPETNCNDTIAMSKNLCERPLGALPDRLPWECHSVGPIWPGSVGLSGAGPMPPYWPAGSRHTPQP